MRSGNPILISFETECLPWHSITFGCIPAPVRIVAKDDKIIITNQQHFSFLKFDEPINGAFLAVFKEAIHVYSISFSSSHTNRDCLIYILWWIFFLDSFCSNVYTILMPIQLNGCSNNFQYISLWMIMFLMVARRWEERKRNWFTIQSIIHSVFCHLAAGGGPQRRHVWQWLRKKGARIESRNVWTHFSKPNLSNHGFFPYHNLHNRRLHEVIMKRMSQIFYLWGCAIYRICYLY